MQQPEMNPTEMPEEKPTMAQPWMEPEDDGEDPAIVQNLEQHLNEITDDQKAFLLANLTPETNALLGILMGREVYEYMSKFVDPSKTIQIVDKPQDTMMPGQQAQAQPQQPAAPQNPQPLSGMR